MNTTSYDDVFNYAKQLGFGDVHIKLDAATGLFAIIALHSTKRGPALGGCRCIEYTSVQDAVYDALRLAQGMSYKAAAAELPLGGGKSVLMKPKQITDRQAYFAAFGRFVEEMGGRYIAAMDSGTEVADMDSIARSTRHVTNTTSNGDPAPYTALAVLRGIEAAVHYKLQRNSLQDLHVAIQGVGHVGYNLAKNLHAKGARLTICDRNPATLERCITQFGAEVVDAEAIYSVKCDIFAPCALGAVINDRTIPLINAPIVAGAANNQLAEPRHGMSLRERGILYAPDYVINVGGLIHALSGYQDMTEHEVQEHIDRVYNTALAIFERAETEGKDTGTVADTYAAERL